MPLPMNSAPDKPTDTEEDLPPPPQAGNHLVMQDSAHAERIDSLSEREKQIEQVWSESDVQEHHARIQDFEQTLGELRAKTEDIRVQVFSLWDYFVSRSLEKIIKQHLRKFLEDLNIEIGIVTPDIQQTSSRLERLIADIASYQRHLGMKQGVVEAMAHRISTLNHLSRMTRRVEGLEQGLLGNAPLMLNAKATAPHAAHAESDISSDLLYLRVRLRTLRAALHASHSSKRITDALPVLSSLAVRAERLHAELGGISTRIVCLTDQAEYWLAFLDMPDDTRSINTRGINGP
ncbi:MAG: hypothetical protein U1F68_18070 [Gammaproteobacteria bacterium]